VSKKRLGGRVSRGVLVAAVVGQDEPARGNLHGQRSNDPPTNAQVKVLPLSKISFADAWLAALLRYACQDRAQQCVELPCGIVTQRFGVVKARGGIELAGPVPGTRSDSSAT